MKRKKLAVIGGGASGLTAAIEAHNTNPNIDITIFERMPKTGKKILATGNGRCNFSNEDLSPKHFYGDYDFLIKILTSPFSNDEKFFQELGVLSYHEDGRIYPRSQQASTIREVLEANLTQKNVNVLLNTSVCEITTDSDRFLINGDTYDAVIICGGGKASPAQGSDGSCYGLAKSLGHSTTALSPALCGLTTDSPYLKLLKGVRCECNVRLIKDNDVAREEAGELQFTDKGISGIPVMNHSYLCTDDSNNVISLDLCFDLSDKYLNDYITSYAEAHPETETEVLLNGIVNNKLCYAIMEALNIKAYTPVSKLSSKQITEISSKLKDFRFNITGNRGFDNAQVTCGGIPTSEIDPYTMMSHIKNGLFFGGEIIDVHGDCGGYNLHLAWTTGRIAGFNASEYLMNKENL